MKVVVDVLGVARSNLIEQRQNATRPRGSYHRADDDVILTAIRAVTDARPTYGYRRVTAILNRTRRTTGEPLLNHKRVFRLMKQGGQLLQRHTGVRRCALMRAASSPPRRTNAGPRMRWRSPSGTARSSRLPLPSTPTTVR